MKLGVWKGNYSLWFVSCAFWFLGSNAAFSFPVETGYVASVHFPKGKDFQKETETFICSQQNLEILTTNLLRDLPSYANRATQRARRLRRETDVYSYMLVAGKPEFVPLALNPGEENIQVRPKTSEDTKQVFFTTLGRQYIGGKVVEVQEFHRLLLTKSDGNWWMVMMFSQTGSYPKTKPPTPPRDSSNGVVAQGIKTWLRDCRAGTVNMSLVISH
ncbi:MAG: hypothetical protein QNJ47_15165 [Nostocaceae cyanobacterium]|nr:hypothetical protein [Nostocaceae cyanobacterium]